MSEKDTASKTPYERTIERIAGELKLLHDQTVFNATMQLGNHGSIVETLPDFKAQAHEMFDHAHCALVMEQVLIRLQARRQDAFGSAPPAPQQPVAGVPMPPPPRSY